NVAGYYDICGDPERFRAVNVEGTRNLLTWLVETGFSGTLHHVSSVAVAGDHRGAFPEDELDVGQGHPHPYHRSKFESERLVRDAEAFGWRIYRPSAVVGDSSTGEID